MNAIVRKSINNFDLSQLLSDIAATLWMWDFRWRSRQQLADLDAHALADMGLSSNKAYRETQKSFWQA